MTSYEKGDHLVFFIKIEFLACMDSFVHTMGKVPRKNIDHRLSYDHFYALRLIDSFSENRRY